METTKELVTIADYAMGRDLLCPEEWTAEVRENAKLLLEKVNALLSELGILSVKVSSGFRPTSINAKIAGAAKKSLHQVGSAIDILDDENQSLGALILKRHDLLEKYGLWIEEPGSTKGKISNWVHLDQGDRKIRPVRVFKP